MTTAIQAIAAATQVNEGEIKSVLSNMIISAKNQHGAQATQAELAVVSGICAMYKLNPLTKEVHAFVSGGKLQVSIGIDGWIKIMNRQPNFDGVEFIDNLDQNGEVVSITTKIYIKGRSYPVSTTEYMDECFQQKSEAWKKFKKRMLRNKSLGQCIRIAFGVSEVIDDDEAERINDYSQTPEHTPEHTENNDVLSDANSKMSACMDEDELKDVAGSIRRELEINGNWNDYKEQITDYFMIHKERINKIEDAEIIDDVEFEEI